MAETTAIPWDPYEPRCRCGNFLEPGYLKGNAHFWGWGCLNCKAFYSLDGREWKEFPT